VESKPWRLMARAYLESRVARRALSVQSRKNYTYVLRDFTDWLDGERFSPDAPCEQIVSHVDGWLGGRSWSSETVCTNLGIVRPFLDWAGGRGLIVPGVTAHLRNPRKGRLLPRAQTTRQVGMLLAAVPDARGRAIVLLEAQAGLRRGEVAAITMGDMDLDDGSLLVHGKGGKERVVWLSDETVGAVRAWLVERGPRPGALICSYDHPGRHLTPTWVGMLVARWMSDAGLKTMPRDGISGHALRHSAATNMLRGGANIRVVQEAMGHEHITTTARYLRADNAEVRQAMRALSYGSKRLRAVGES
jgi:site-specific recombinase XerD